MTKAKYESKLFEELREEFDEIELAKNEVISQIKTTLISTLKTIVKSNDQIEQLTWTQYTPHYNDGEACEFSVHCLEIKLVGEEETVDAYYFKNNGKLKDAKEIGAAMEDLDTFMSDDLVCNVLRSEFGDGVRVIVNKKSIEVEDYDHD